MPISGINEKPKQETPKPVINQATTNVGSNTKEALAKAFEIYYKHGQSSNALVNGVIEALVADAISERKVNEIKIKIDNAQTETEIEFK